MALTVPTAGVIAGAAPNVQVPVPDTGAVLSEFGGKMAEIAGRWKQERLDTQGRRAVLGMTRDLGALRQEVQQMPDPEAAAATWDRRAAEIRSTYFTEGLDPSLATEMDLAWTELKDRHDYDLGGWMIGQRSSWQNAEWVAQSAEISAAAVGADDTTFEALLGQAQAGIEARLASGAITPEQAAVEWSEKQAELYGTKANGLISADPQAFIDAAGRGEFAGLGAGLDGKIGEANAELASRAAKEAVAAKDAYGRWTAQQKDQLREGTSILLSGSRFENRAQADAALASDPDLAGSPEGRAYAAAVRVSTVLPAYATLPLDEKRKLLAEQQAVPVSESTDTKLIDGMKASIAAHEAALRDGTIWTFATQANVIKPTQAELPPPQATSDDDLRIALRNRAMIDAAGLQATGLTGKDAKDQPLPPPVFTPEERAQWAPLADKMASPGDRARLAGLLGSLPQETAERAARELGADGLFTYVGSGMAVGAFRPEVPTRMFEGVRAQENGDVKLAPQTARRSKFFTDFGALFSDGTVTLEGGRTVDESATRNNIIAAADAYYAYLVRGTDKALDGATINEAIYKDALHAALGGQGAFGDSSAPGGLGELSSASGSYTTILPPWISADQVEAARRVAIMGFAGAPKTGKPPAWTADAAGWRAISAEGQIPDIDGQLPSSGTFAALQLDPVEGNVYTLKTAKGVTVTDASGQPFLLDITKFAALAGGAP